MIGQPHELSGITNWYILHRLKPQFLARIASFIVFGESGTDLLLVTDDDHVYGYGTNRFGGLGLGHRDEIAHEPAELVELRGKRVAALAYGAKHVIARTATGEIYAWGDNSYGQLGSTNSFESLRPTLIGKHIVAIACGANHTVAIATSGQVFAWGRNNYGQIGVANNINQLLPAKITDLDPHYVCAIACGASHTLALTAAGEVFGWGSNSFGQLGTGNCTHQTSPVPVKILTTNTGSGTGTGSGGSPSRIIVKAIACGPNHSLLLSSAGEIYAFGRNEFGQLGCPAIPASDGVCTPTKIVCTAAGRTRFLAISSHFAANLCAAISQCGYCFVWGDAANEPAPIRAPRETPLYAISDAFAIYSKRRNTPPTSGITGEPEMSTKRMTFNRVMDKLANSFDQPDTSDLQFIVGGESIYVHRWFLKISSTYFDRMLSKTWCDPERSKIEITDYSYDVFYAYLRYIYTDCVEVRLDDALELLDLANCYLEDDLKQKCVNIIRQNLSIANCCRLYQLAVQYGLADFEKYVVTFAFNHVFEVCRSDGFRAMNSEICKCLLLSVSDMA